MGADLVSDLLPANAFGAIVVLVLVAAWAVAWLVLPFLVIGIFDRLGEVRDELRRVNVRSAARADPRVKPGEAPATRVKPLISSPP